MTRPLDEIQLDLLEKTWRHAQEHRTELTNALSAQEERVRNAYREWMAAKWGLVPEVTRLRRTGAGRNAGKEHILARISTELTSGPKPWLVAYRMRRDGTPGANTVNLFDEWEIVE